jgi:uncharacterized damage-inducible protein DinB
MNKTDLQHLIDYHYWARDRLLAAVERLSPDQFTKDLGSSSPSVRDTVGHLYFAEWAWNERWHGRSPTAPPPPFEDAASVKQAWTTLESQVRGFVKELTDDDISRVIEYRLLSGTPGASAIWQMVHQVVNHASYHRGQVTTMIRQLGGVPPQSMDLITWFRSMEQGRG